MIWTLSTFYKSIDWETFREILIEQRTDPETGLLYCEHCGKPIVKAYDIIGHHKIELTEKNVNDKNISLNPENVMLVHHKCHNQIHQRFGYTQRKAYIIYGPPLSGKSSYVRNLAGKDDLILDIDRIYEMISVNAPYEKPDSLSTCVFAIRDQILDMVKARRGKWRNAYIIGGYPTARERRDLARMLNAELVPLLEPMEVCLDRLASCADGRDHKAWEQHIRRWFERAS